MAKVGVGGDGTGDVYEVELQYNPLRENIDPLCENPTRKAAELVVTEEVQQHMHGEYSNIADGPVLPPFPLP